MKEFQAILTAFDDWLWGNWLLFVLLGVGILYTVITGGNPGTAFWIHNQEDRVGANPFQE